MTTTDKLADALRAVIDTAPGGVRANEADNIAAKRDGILALAAYDARLSRMATDYRVTTEWDAFDADSPRAAAVEVWQRIRESAGPVFTVRCSDGRILDVDLSDETDEGVEA